MGATTIETADRCGTALGDHCPKCGTCDCMVTRGARHSECLHVERVGTLTPFSR